MQMIHMKVCYIYWERGSDPNNDNIIWDLAYNARVEAMRALLTSDDVDLTEKNEVGHERFVYGA